MHRMMCVTDVCVGVLNRILARDVNLRTKFVQGLARSGLQLPGENLHMGRSLREFRLITC